MTPSLPCATVIDADGRHDLAVPKGMTIAGLMATLRIDPEANGLSLTGPDGRPLDPGAAIGAEIPSGAIVALIGDGRLTTEERERLKGRRNETLPLGFIALLTFFPIALIEVGVFVLPLLGLFDAPIWLRIGAGLISVIACGLVLRDRHTRRTTWILLVLSLLFGLSGLALLPPGPTPPLQLAPVIVSWTALVGAFGAGLFLDSSRCRAIAIAWAIIAFIAAISTFFATSFSMIAPLILAACIVLIAAAPSLAMRLPENQLLDLPKVATSASTLRALEPDAPSKITMGRIARTLSEARSRADVVFLISGAFVLTAAPFAYANISPSTWQGRACIVLAVCAPIVLAADGRGRRERLARILPRVLACALIVEALISKPCLDLFGPVTVAIALTSTALIIGVAGVLFAASNGSALVGRLADIGRAFALTFLIPAAVFASGLFDLLRQAAS